MKHLLIILLLFSFVSIAKAIDPDREYHYTPDKLGLAYSEFQLITTDHYTINAWEYPRPDSIKANRTIILVGTDAGNMSYLIGQANAFVSKGFRVIAFDYRGFGKSSDFAMERDFLFHTEFALDLDTVIQATRAKYPQDKIGLYSLSMGTHVSLWSKEQVDFSIAEGFYHDPQKVVDRIKLNKDKPIFLPPGAKPITKLKHETPMLIFCASKDKTTITEDAKDFSKRNQISIVEFDGDHLAGMNVFTKLGFGDVYTDMIISFLDKSGI